MELTSYTCQVFLSFRGADTRKNFTDHLYSALIKAGIYTFRDDNNIQRGENIESEIERAIQESKMSVVVFSKDYASSPWCLDELVMIMDRRRTAGHIVLPVFYDVDPDEVGEQTGSYGEAFARHQDSFQDEMERLERWRAALKQAAYLGGMVLQERHESQFIQDIVQEVEKKLDSIALFAPYIAWYKYRPLVKMIGTMIHIIVGIIFLLVFCLAFGWGLYKLISTDGDMEPGMRLFPEGLHKLLGTDGAMEPGMRLFPKTTETTTVELLGNSYSAGTKKNIEYLGIKSICSLVLAFSLSRFFL